MKLGLLGGDRQTLAVAAAGLAAGDVIGPAIGPPPDLSAPGAGIDWQPAEQWQLLLEADRCDSVLVAVDGWTDERAEQVRTLVQTGRPLLLNHPACLSMLWAYELDMILADSPAGIVPFLPARRHPLVGTLRQFIEQAIAGGGPFGSLETLQLERRQADRSRDAVLASLARDADLIRVLVGDPARLMTLGSGGDAAWPTLAVGLTGPDQLPVRWQVAKAATSRLVIELICATGRLRIEAPGDLAGSWQLHQLPDASGQPLPLDHPEDSPAFDPAAVMLETLRQQVAGTFEETAGDTIAAATWADAARTIELAETVPRSLTKGRAIDLHQEEFSELGTFRGTMASLGCGIIMAGLLLLFLATLVGGVARAAGWEFGERLASFWPYVILLTLLLFLTLQLLPLLLPKPAGPPPDVDEPPPQPDPPPA
jgi:hypothetical protein